MAVTNTATTGRGGGVRGGPDDRRSRLADPPSEAVRGIIIDLMRAIVFAGLFR
jgi:hypothetical protein